MRDARARPREAARTGPLLASPRATLAARGPTSVRTGDRAAGRDDRTPVPRLLGELTQLECQQRAEAPGVESLRFAVAVLRPRDETDAQVAGAVFLGLLDLGHQPQRLRQIG
jgi:hypothetical protein